MHKSLGNVVDPVEIANKLGGEIVRLWVASIDFREDVRSSDELMQRVAENYRKLRNTFRNMLANLSDFDPRQNQVEWQRMRPLDRYLLLRTAELTEEVRAEYERFEFHRIYHRLLEFCAVELSAFYFDALKDRLYTWAPDSIGRRSAQTALWRIAEALARLLAPVMSFTADEVWSFLPAFKETESVHLALFPSADELAPSQARADKTFLDEWSSLLRIREQVLKALEEARQAKTIGSSLEAEVTLSLPAADLRIAERNAEGLRELFIVSGVQLRPAAEGNGNSPTTVEVQHAAGRKCDRCWNYSSHVGEDSLYPTVCERCSKVLAEIGAAAEA